MRINLNQLDKYLNMSESITYIGIGTARVSEWME